MKTVKNIYDIGAPFVLHMWGLIIIKVKPTSDKSSFYMFRVARVNMVFWTEFKQAIILCTRCGLRAP